MSERFLGVLEVLAADREEPRSLQVGGFVGGSICVVSCTTVSPELAPGVAVCMRGHGCNLRQPAKPETTRSEDSVVVPRRSALRSHRLEAEASDDGDRDGDADSVTGAFCSALDLTIGRSCSGDPQG